MFIWLKSPELQGAAALIALIEFGILTWKSLRRPSQAPVQPPSPPPTPHDKPVDSAYAKIIGIVLLLITGWITYSIPWTLIAYSINLSPMVVVSMLFFVLGSLPAIGALLTKAPAVGGFLGGGLPLGVYAIYGASTDPSWNQIAPFFAWFVVFFLIGGVLGALTGPMTLKILRNLRLPLPFG